MGWIEKEAAYTNWWDIPPHSGLSRHDLEELKNTHYHEDVATLLAQIIDANDLAKVAATAKMPEDDVMDFLAGSFDRTNTPVEKLNQLLNSLPSLTESQKAYMVDLWNNHQPGEFEGRWKLDCPICKDIRKYFYR